MQRGAGRGQARGARPVPPPGGEGEDGDLPDPSTWDLHGERVDGEGDGTVELVEEALDSIALRVIEHLEDLRKEDGYGNRTGKGKRVQPGEQCMLL